MLLAMAPPQIAATQVLGPGQTAPDFSLTRIDGAQFQLSDFKGKKPVYLVFWNTWCSHCLKKVDRMKAMHNDFTSEIEMLAINTSRSDSVVLINAFVSEFTPNYPIAFDNNAKVTDLYEVWGTPTDFLIDRQGIIRMRDGSSDQMTAYLASLKKAAVKNTEAVTGECRRTEQC